MPSVRFLKHIKRLISIYQLFVYRTRIIGHFKLLKYMVLRFFLKRNIPASIMISITYNCQNDCIHCSSWNLKEDKNIELSSSEIIQIINDADLLSIPKIGFTGGEPLLRNDIIPLINYAYNKGFSTSIDTNGILLTHEKVKELKNAGLTNINISIDHFDAKVHDRLRKNPGCYQKALNAIKYCVSETLPCTISTYVTDNSFKTRSIHKIINLGRSLKVNGVRVLFPINAGKLEHITRPLLSDKNRIYFFSKMVDSSFVYSESPLFDFTTAKVECSAAKKLSIYISSYGDIKYCYKDNNSLGNIRNQSLIDILNSKGYFVQTGGISFNCSVCRN